MGRVKLDIPLEYRVSGFEFIYLWKTYVHGLYSEGAYYSYTINRGQHIYVHDIIYPKGSQIGFKVIEVWRNSSDQVVSIILENAGLDKKTMEEILFLVPRTIQDEV